MGLFVFFSCKACGILVPQSGIEPTSPACGSLNHWTAREVPNFIFNKGCT